jgi:hypothetical protein
MSKQQQTSDFVDNHFTSYTRPLLNKVDQPGWKPKHKQDVVDLLMEVQIGYVSCSRAASILFPELL